MQYRARYYDPAVGTFVGEDPLGFGAGDANLYRYVFNSPTNFTDPSGRSAEIPYGHIARETAIGVGAAAVATYQLGKNIVNEWKTLPRQTESPTSFEPFSIPNLPGAGAFPTTVATPGEFSPNPDRSRDNPLGNLTPPAPRPKTGELEYPHTGNTDAKPNFVEGGFCPVPGLDNDGKPDFPSPYFESGLEPSFEPKINKQLPKRGWTADDVRELIENPGRTVPTRDTRYLPDGTRANAPATAYIDKDGNYVVQNDETGDIVQVSDRNDPGWKAPF